MQEHSWVPSQDVSMTSEFLLDVLMGHGDQLAREHFPPEAFADWTPLRVRPPWPSQMQGRNKNTLEP